MGDCVDRRLGFPPGPELLMELLSCGRAAVGVETAGLAAAEAAVAVVAMEKGAHDRHAVWSRWRISAKDGGAAGGGKVERAGSAGGERGGRKAGVLAKKPLRNPAPRKER